MDVVQESPSPLQKDEAAQSDAQRLNQFDRLFELDMPPTNQGEDDPIADLSASTSAISLQPGQQQQPEYEGPWSDFFNFAQEVQQAYRQVESLHDEDYWECPIGDEYGPDGIEYGACIFHVILNSLEDVRNKIRSILQLVYKQISEHRSNEALGQFGKIDDKNLDGGLPSKVKLLYWHYEYIIAPQEFSWLRDSEDGYFKLIPKRSSRPLQKMRVIRGKMYLWSVIEAMMNEWLEEVDAIDNEIWAEVTAYREKAALRSAAATVSARDMGTVSAENDGVPEYDDSDSDDDLSYHPSGEAEHL